jgi:type IV pilus assembly protein PilO
MASKSSKTSAKVDFSALRGRVASQFRGLSLQDGASWPALPRYLLFALIAALVLVALWMFWLRQVDEDLDNVRAQEPKLKQEYQTKLQKAVSLDALEKQKEQVAQYVAVLEKQLPGKAEMDALLSDINQAGLGRSLQFDLFKPGQVDVKDYYAELPIALKITGRFHDMGAFTSDIAHLSRIVTLNNVSIAPGNAKDNSGLLVMQATAKTFRYLDPDEIAAQRQAKQKAGAKK